MAAWSDKNPSCIVTWITLALLEQSTKAFPRSKTVKMRHLMYWSGSDGARRARARTLAIQVDGVLREIARAKYETGVQKRKAVSDMLGVFLDGDKTMPELAAINDGNYRFLGE